MVVVVVSVMGLVGDLQKQKLIGPRAPRTTDTHRRIEILGPQKLKHVIIIQQLRVRSLSLDYGDLLCCGYGGQRRLHFHQGEVDVLF